MRAKLQEIQQELRRRRHQAIPYQGEWLRSVVSGYFNNHAVPTAARQQSCPVIDTQVGRFGRPEGGRSPTVGRLNRRRGFYPPLWSRRA